MTETKSTFMTKSSVVVEKCQVCGNTQLDNVLFLGYLPPVNQMWAIGSKPHEQPAYPAGIVRCTNCNLVQLGLIVDSTVLFPAEYPYTSSTTRILRENFAELYQECSSLINLAADDLIVDIGSNDGNLLSNFKDNHRVLGVTPEDICKIAIERGIPTIQDYFQPKVVAKIKQEYGKAKIVTATNVFAHIEKVNDVVNNICELLNDDGVFISESHYLLPLVETVQYDTIYHEHLRYYSLHALKFLLERHDLIVFHVKRIPTHGGSIRVYACRTGQREADESVAVQLKAEAESIMKPECLQKFKQRTVNSKLALHALLFNIKNKGERIFGIGAPSRASTLINYVGLDDGIIDVVLEIKGSYKVGKYMPGTLIPVEDEVRLFDEQPEYAMLFSWHIADELIPKLKDKGFKGKFIVPLPEPRIVD